MKIETTPTLTYKKDTNGIVFSTIKEGTYLELEDVKTNIEVFNKFVANTYTPVFSDIRGLKGISIDARKFTKSEECTFYINATAILVDSLLTKMIGNFVLNFNKPEYPTVIFTDKDKAIDWLKKYIINE